MRTLMLAGAALALFAAGIASGQAPAPAPASAAPVPQAVSPAEQPAGFTYKAEGRRDPFVNLLRRGDSLTPFVPRPAGLSGLLTAEVTLRGVVQGQNGFVGMLLGTDQRTYIVRPGDRLFDGAVHSITPNALVIMQRVDDPLSPEKQREIRKTLRQTDEAQP